MKRLNEIRLVNHSKFVSKKTPRRDKILMSMLDDKLRLADDDEAYKDLLIKAFTICQEYPLMTTQVKMLQAIGLSYSHSYKVIADAQYIFGNVQETNKLFLKNASRERLYALKAKLEEDRKPDYALILKVEELLIKLDDLPSVKTDQEGNDIDDLTIPVVVFTSDPRSLIEEATISNDEEE